MSGTDRGYGVGLSPSAWEKRNKQLQNWETSDTNHQPSYPLPTRKSRVHFSKDVMFLAAVNAGDEEEVERLLTEEGADINCRNNDGLSAVHQCCIDDDIDMLKVIIKRGGDINSVDNEGWTPLHAAASCGYIHIVKYLLECGSFPASINNDGQTPSDLAEDYDEIVEVLQSEINRLGIDIDDIKCEEERRMLEDANKLRNNPEIESVLCTGGATPLHVAAAKNYTTVLNVLLSIKELDIINARDDDGWTPLHAAVHWESMEAAELLILSGANIFAKTDAGEEADDLVDPDLEEEWKELKKLNSRINPEQEFRKRRHQVTRRSSSTFSHSNSIDNKYHQPISRRHSKEKLTMRDMKKEKEDLIQSFEKLDEEINNSNSSSQTTPTCQVGPTPTSNINNNSPPIPIPGTSGGPPPMVRTNSSGSNGGSPKNSRRKGELSKNMLDRLNVFQSPGPPGSPSVTTSTPSSSPAAAGTTNNTNNERKKIDSSESAGVRLRVSEQTVGGGANPKNRFSFQPKPVVGAGTPQGKTMSLERGTEASLIKETSYTPPAGAGRTIVESKPIKKHQEPTNASLAETISAAGQQATPTGQQATPIVEQATPTKLDSSATDSSSILSDRSVTTQPEARRRTNAKSKREARRSTQPLPTDLLERITKHDQMEEQQLNTTTDEQTATGKQMLDIASSVSNHIQSTEATPTMTTPTSVDRVTAYGKGDKRVSLTTPTTSQLTTPTSAKEDKTLSAGSPKDQSITETSSPLPRTKSSTRRKPKEKRRSTGIPTEVDSECEIPDNLKGIINHSRSESADSNDSNGLANNVFDIQGTEGLSVSSATIDYYQQEMASLKKFLSDEKKKNETLMHTYHHTCNKLESVEKELNELKIKFDKEKMEGEQKEKRIIQLEKSQRGIQELKTENQRLKDENGALIRVVGKLSRAPFNS